MTRYVRLLIVTILLTLGAAASLAQKPTVSLEQSVQQADLIVVARPATAPSTAPADPDRSTVWIAVDKTLLGLDLAGSRTRVRLGGLALEPGQAYVLFLRWRDLQTPSAVPQMRTQATEANLKAVSALLGPDPKVLPPVRLVVRHTAGWGGGVLLEFRLAPDGSFTCIQRTPNRDPAAPPVVTQLAGRLPREAADQLVKQIAKLPAETVMADDAGIVELFWQDEGIAAGRLFTMPGRSPAADALKLITDVTAAHGQPATHP